jgi:chromosome segregation ATPase
MSSSSSSSPDANAVVLMDRFVSASSPQDAVESLQAIVKGLKDGEWPHDWIFEHGAELLDGLLQLLQHGTLNQDKVECEDGVPLVCQIFLELKNHPMVLQKPAPGRLLEALLDVMENGQEGAAAPPKSAYTRVLALQVLEGISKAHMSKASTSSQWLQAPNGLHRLADLIDNDTEEVVRNQALLVLRILATQAPMAKVFLFAELDVKLLDFCWHVGGGLTKGNTVVLDALELISELHKHADASLQDLVWQRPTVAPRLAQLLDLRGGDEFLHPPKQKSRPQDDDLDDLLNSGSSATKKEDTNKDKDKDAPFIPRLLPAEEKVIQLVLQILSQLLDSESLRPVIWKQHFGLCCLVWELALMGPAVQPPVCSRPSPQLQQAALELVAQKFNDPVLMDRLAGLDRLLYLVVTGGSTSTSTSGGGGVDVDEDQTRNSAAALGISQAALSVLRNILDESRINELLLHTLAPPPVDEDESNPQPAPGPTVVQKLWNTVAQNLTTAPADDDDPSKTTNTNHSNRSLFLSGALGGLALLLKTEESREMMFKAMTVTMDQFLETLETEKDEMVQWTLLRFLCEWIFQSPLLVQSLLSSTMSTHLASMASTQGKSNPLLYLLLGLAMDSISEQTTECGGWTREGILQVLQSVGIAKITTRLESLKNKSAGFPWSECALEYKHWKGWYQKAVWIVRKRIVEELAKASGDDSSDEEAEGEVTATLAQSSEPSTPTHPSSHSNNSKTLHKLLNQQSKEMEELRQAFDEAQAKIMVQETQLETWKRRMESTPTELDTMLNEFTTKTANLEETIHKMQTEAKQTQTQHETELQNRDEALEEQRQDAERLRTEEQEASEDRDRMEQELQGLSQAYASLEEEYRQHTASSAGAPTGENGDQPPQQSQGEDSQQNSTTTGSTEVATLREEINRLRGENGRLRSSAMEADNWMSMAVQRMNDLGAENANLQQQESTLQGQLQHVQVANQEQADQQTQERIAAAESQLRKEVSLRQGVEAQLSVASGEIEMQRQQMVQLQNQLASVQEELRVTAENAQADTIDLQRQLEETRQQPSDGSEIEGQRILELQQQLSSAQEESRVTTEQMQAQIVELNVQLDVAQQQQLLDVSSDAVVDIRLQQPRNELENTAASKDAEIEALQTSLEQSKQAASVQPTTEGTSHASSAPPTANSEHFQLQLEAARHEAEEINRRSQEEIYKKESRIRELEDRLNSGLGEYKMEDISIRDEEIEELRSANETAQEWMAKAVEHHQLLTNQVRALTEEKSALSSQLNDFKGQPNSNASDASLKLFESQLEQTATELDDVRSKLASREQELTSLKTASSGLEQELEIARDDLGNLQRQFEQSQETVSTLESRLAENAFSTENETLRASNQDLNSRLEEFQTWADMAQTKISEILAAKENAEKLLVDANDRLHTKDKKMKALEDKLETMQSGSETEPYVVSETDDAVDQAKAKLEALESANKTLSHDCETHKTQLAELQGHYSELQVWAETARQRISELSGIEKSPIVQNEGEPSDALKEGVTAEKTNCEDYETNKKQLTELESSYNELQAWTEGARQKISDLLQLQKDLESSLSVAKQEAETSRDENERLRQQIPSEKAETVGVPTQEPRRDVVQMNAAKDFFVETASSSTTAEAFFGSEQNSTESNPAEQFFVSTQSGSESGNIVDFLQQQLRQKEEDLRLLQEKLSDDDDIVQKWEGKIDQEVHVYDIYIPGVDTCFFSTDRVAELENEVKSLQEQIREQEDQANSAITQWQESFADSEKKCSQLEAELVAAQKEIESLQDSKASLENDYRGIESSTKELELASLEHAVDEEMDELHDAEPETKEEIDEGVENLKRELKLEQGILSRDDDIVAEWEGKFGDHLIGFLHYF